MKSGGVEDGGKRRYEVFFVRVEAVWGGENVWVDYKGVFDACMTCS